MKNGYFEVMYITISLLLEYSSYFKLPFIASIYNCVLNGSFGLTFDIKSEFD